MIATLMACRQLLVAAVASPLVNNVMAQPGSCEIVFVYVPCPSRLVGTDLARCFLVTVVSSDTDDVGGYR